MPQAVKRSNTQVLRVGFLWQALEPQRDVYDWELLDRTVALMREARIRPMITVFGSADWASGGTPGINCACDRAADPDWQDLWRSLALRYPDAVLNVWNEPNIPAFGNVSTERMAELVNLAAAAIWEVDPGRLVVGPPTAPWGDWPAYSEALYSRLDRRIAFSANLYPRGRIIDNLRHAARRGTPDRGSAAGLDHGDQRLAPRGLRAGSSRGTCARSTGWRGAAGSRP